MPTNPVPRLVTLVGSLQTALGGASDWDPGSLATRLDRVGEGPTYARSWTVPAGAYELKVALDGSWAENYGAGGAPHGPNIPLRVDGPTRLEFTWDVATRRLGIVPLDLSGPREPGDGALARDSLRAPVTRERFYFLIADRFARSATASLTGGLTGDRLSTGYDPTDKAFYHGGDLRGIIERLDYLRGLGTTAIWLTPSFANRPVQFHPAKGWEAGYHGYWITDFTRIDPHLGTNEDLHDLVDAAHARGMKVFLDIIGNHTADVIQLRDRDGGGPFREYRGKDRFPYRDARGVAFDDADYAAGDTFPAIDAATSFPYVPTFATEADRTAKKPAWLNDPTMYHNRGDFAAYGEQARYGDFDGLDDLWTERPEVVAGLIDIYRSWATSGVDGFRIDTMKHVNLEFWERFSPAILEAAAAAGRPDFFMFGEVYETDPARTSQYTTTGRVQATLDFGFQAAAESFCASAPTVALRDFFMGDDWYTDENSNAYQLPTFLGNHDMGRIATRLVARGFTGGELFARCRLAHELMYLTRGQPVVYYGDEQGFIGTGGDHDARQDLFATQVTHYADEPLLGGGTMGRADHYDTTSRTYRHIATLAGLRAAHPALADGAQIHRYASTGPGIYAISRVWAREGVEYLVVVNNASTPAEASFPTYVPRATFYSVYGGADPAPATPPLTADGHGRVSVRVEPLSSVVFRADRPIAPPPAPPLVWLTTPAPGGVVGGRTPVVASVSSASFVQVSFAARVVGAADWVHLGTDDAPPYRIFHDVSALPAGTLVEYRAVARDLAGGLGADSTYGLVGDPGSGDPRAPGPARGVGPVLQPRSVAVPGTHALAWGSDAAWRPDDPVVQLDLDLQDGTWKRRYDDLPPGDYRFKAALDGSWEVNYGANGRRDGDDLAYRTEGGPVTFAFDPATHYVATDAEVPFVTAPGDYQAALGCGADWRPECLRPWLQDLDGDGTYTWSTTDLPAGRYEFKIAHGLTWAENYGAGGVPAGHNLVLEVPHDGDQVTLAYAPATHATTVTVVPRAPTPDLTAALAVWVAPGLLAWPAWALPAGADPARLRWRMHTSPSGELALDAEAVVGGTTADLVLDPAGLPADVLAARPQLAGYLAVRAAPPVAAAAPGALRGQVVVGLYDDLSRLLHATGVQVAPVLDELYAASAAARSYGVTWAGGRPTVRVWAPTARTVTLLTWPRPAADPADPAPLPDAPPTQATRIPLTRDDDGSWSVDGTADWREARYLFEVEVFVRATGRVETNLVTDPYARALTVDSTRAVMVDLDDPALAPPVWRTATPPRLERSVDQTIYELHVRDFSVGDEAVPPGHRGGYLAFADDGAGMRHLRALARAGLNTVHLLPTYDFGSVPERPDQRSIPPTGLAAYPPDSPEPQRLLEPTLAGDAFNWGYDPLHYLAPEGSYASTPAAADGGARVVEFRTMVGALHEAGLRVVLDQVFNHTYAAGQDPRAVLDRVVPGYYHRLDERGQVMAPGGLCLTATEHAMMRKLMVDAVVGWARDYRVDGFRFDLMAYHDVPTLAAVRTALDRLTPAADGVDGRAITLYGEGWAADTLPASIVRPAVLGALGGTDIATFNDRLRDVVRDGVLLGSAAEPWWSAHPTDLLQVGLAGSLRGFAFRSQERHQDVRGTEVDGPHGVAAYADEPGEVVNYVDAHDNETLYDALVLSLPRWTTMADRIRINTLALAAVTLAQGVCFWHAGTDLLRSKSFDRDSYDSGDWFNSLDFTGQDSGYGRGLPRAVKNGPAWGRLRPLLADPGLRPTPGDIGVATAAAQDLLRIRASTRLFRLGSAAAITAKLTFPVSGRSASIPGVVVLLLDDTRGHRVDDRWARVLVVYNARPESVGQAVPSLAGHRLRLHPVLEAATDPVARTAAWDAALGLARVPARTVSVFVEPR